MHSIYFDISRKITKIRRKITYLETKESLAKTVGISGEWGTAPNFGTLIYHQHLVVTDPYPSTGTKANIPCKHCGETTKVIWESSKTMYHWNMNETSLDPNRNIALCRGCAKSHHEYWDDLWAEYYSGRGGY